MLRKFNFFIAWLTAKPTSVSKVKRNFYRGKSAHIKISQKSLRVRSEWRLINVKNDSEIANRDSKQSMEPLKIGMGIKLTTL